MTCRKNQTGQGQPAYNVLSFCDMHVRVVEPLSPLQNSGHSCAKQQELTCVWGHHLTTRCGSGAWGLLVLSSSPP